MSVTVYDTTIGNLSQGVESLIAILKKGSEHSDAASFPSATLIEDMKPLTFQVQIALAMAKNTAAYIYGVEAGAPQEDKTMEDMIAHCEKTLALLKSVDAKSIGDKAADTKINVKLGPTVEATITVQEYVFGHVLPNFFFHLTTAYNILRMKGVPLGKMDYLTPFMTFQK